MGTRELTEVEKAWLACAIDGEGSIFFDKEGKYPVVIVYNTDIKFIEQTSLLMGKSINSWNKHSNGKNTKSHWKTCYQVKVSGTKCIELLEQIYPYLIIKQQKALKAIKCVVLTRQEHLKILNTNRKKRDDKGRFV